MYCVHLLPVSSVNKDNTKSNPNKPSNFVLHRKIQEMRSEDKFLF